MIGRLFGSSERSARRFAVPDGTRVYAIGDIHGCADLLRAIHRQIEDDMAAAPKERCVVVYVGDYVDRGEDSRGVIDLMLDAAPPGAETVHLMGNHERFMLDFLEDTAVGPDWLINGGDRTLFSYGIGYPPADTAEERLERMRLALNQALPERHRSFLSGLPLSHREGDYLFVHAGIRPGRPLEEQSEDDLLWIRQAFLGSDADFGVCVVHGHTPVREPEIRGNRVAIDTGAVFTGHLTCLVLEGEERRFLAT